MIAQLDKDYLRIRPAKIYNRLTSYAFFEGRPLTTSGRWINPLVFAGYNAYKSLPQLKKVQKPVFILGTGRSGTTLLGMLMSMHRDVGFLNEPKAMWHSVYPFEDLIGSYTDNHAYVELDRDVVTPRIKREMHKLYGAYLSLASAKRVVDKYPELIFRINFVREIFPDARFIFLVRNGWDTVSSIDSWSVRKGSYEGGQTEDWWGRNNRKWNLLLNQLITNDAQLSSSFKELSMVKDHPTMAAAEWILTMKAGIKELQNKPSDLLLVKYEELTADPQGTLGLIREFCELREDPKMDLYAQKVVQPMDSKREVEIHEKLRSSFSDVMQYFDYEPFKIQSESFGR